MEENLPDVSILDGLINQEILDAIIEYKKLHQLHSESEGGVCSFEDLMGSISRSSDSSETDLSIILMSYPLEEVRKVYAFYYYGRGFNDFSNTPHWSFEDDLNEAKKDSVDQVYNKLDDLSYDAFRLNIIAGIENYPRHESEVVKEKEIWKRRINSYTKPSSHKFFEIEKRNINLSTSETFRNVLSRLPNGATKDINEARNIIQSLIDETGGLIVADFLNSGFHDALDYVDNDGEFLKIYQRYSRGSNVYPSPPHNVRFDMAFDELKRIDMFDLTGIALKGYYRGKKEIKNYYANKEGVKKIYSFYEIKNSNFYYNINFDKRQEGAIENFDVSCLPFRYFNVVIFPKSGLAGTIESSYALIIQNVIDAHNRGVNAYNDFYRLSNHGDEDQITAFGNKIRKIVENYLKFILLSSKIMFDENYEKDMLGSMLLRIKEAASSGEDCFFYDKNKLFEIANLVENKMLETLNLCSHDNVRVRINKDIVDSIYHEFFKIKDLALSCLITKKF